MVLNVALTLDNSDGNAVVTLGATNVPRRQLKHISSFGEASSVGQRFVRIDKNSFVGTSVKKIFNKFLYNES